MSVLIKGMNMPTSCNICPMLEGNSLDGLCHAANRWLDDERWGWCRYPEGDVDDSRPLNCPLVEIPVPHGRLIDADALPHYTGYALSANEVAKAVEAAPTIIEADDFCPHCRSKNEEMQEVANKDAFYGESLND